MAIDENLLADMRSGKVVLFLGAGASRGARASDGRFIPDAEELGKKLSTKFLGGRYAERDFKSIYDFACSRASVREVQEFLHEELDAYQPAPFHELIPTFIWAGIATTNYDLLIERAFQKCGSRSLRRLRPFRSDADIPKDDFDATELLYNKLHGCITQYHEVNPPLIASTEQLIDHREGRAGQFQTFLEWAQTRPIVFAGYRADDSNLRTLINQIVKEGDKRPRHYIVRPGIEKEERDYWEDRRFRAVPMTFEDFINALNAEFTAGARTLASLATATTKTTFSKFISTPHSVESVALLRYFSSGCEHVDQDLHAPSPDARRFYSGFDIGWSSIEGGLDVSRRITRAILADQIVTRTDASPAALIALKAHAGAGKTVILRRIAWDAAKVHNKLVLYINKLGRIDFDCFEEIFSLTNRAVILVIDNAAHFASPLASLVGRARKKKWPLVVITAERINEWNVSCDELDDEVDHEYELKYLSKGEIGQLLSLLARHNCLGFLASIPEQDRPKHLEERYGRQLLVALHEATKNANFRDIVADEYSRIIPAEARLLYLDICALNRFGTPVRAGLIARVHGIDFDEFRDRFFRPLEEVVDLRMDSRTNDYIYEARHPMIAEMVYASSLVTNDERFDNVMRILGKLNPTYSYDQDVLFHLIRASSVDELFPDRLKGEAIYQAAASTFGETAGVLHQWGLYEMHRAGEAGGLDRAQGLIERALEEDSTNRAIQHSLAELSLRRSRIAGNSAEREGYRKEATQRAASLARSGRSSFPFHTMAKAANDAVADTLKRLDQSQDTLSELAADEAIKNAEDVLRRGLQRFPGDDRLLTAEAELGTILNNAPRALQALIRAFKTNPRSELVARRLAKAQKASGSLAGAIATLREALSHNSGSQHLNFDMAMCLLELAPDADQKDADGAILFHLSRSFQRGDKNYQAQFWCARQYWISAKYSDAKAIYDVLGAARLGHRYKIDTRAPILDATGKPIRFNGVLQRMGEGYGFIRIDGRNASIFFPQSSNVESRDFDKDARVTFEIAFSLKGAVALDIRPLLI